MRASTCSAIPVDAILVTNGAGIASTGIAEHVLALMLAFCRNHHVAARLQQTADSGEILIGPGARRLAVGCVELESSGVLELRGFDEPVEAWRVIGTRGGPDGMPSVAAPLVGRDAELELLSNTFARVVRDSRPHLFTVYGEPGIGKSRLVREFVDGLEGATVLSGRCLPYGEGITYWPLAEMVKTVAGISDDDPIEEAFEKLRACCEDEAVADLLGLASGVLEALEGERSQQEIAWAARAFVDKLAEAQPLVLAFEDIHWAEEPLLELIEHLADWVRAPVLLLSLARPELLEVHQGWGGGRLRATAIELEPLGPQESESLVEALVSDTSSLSAEARRALLEKTEGNPLFVEEMIRSLVERGVLRGERGAYAPTAPIEEITLPETVQAVLASRIDRLSPRDKDVLQTAAVVGRDVPAELLRVVVDLPGPELAASLERLATAELLGPAERPGERAFRHPLTHEVAYRTQLLDRRRRTHAGVARALLAIHGSAAPTHAALLAHHFEEAGEHLEAARWHESAGRRVARRDPAHGAEHCHRVTKLLAALPESRETLMLELTSRIALLEIGRAIDTKLRRVGVRL